MSLNLRQKKFIDAYIETGNASQSAIDAGYSKKNSRSTGSKLLKNPEIKAAIKQEFKELHDENIMNIDEILSNLSDIGRGDATELTWNPSTTQYDEIPAKIADRIKAMELIGKRYGAWVDKTETTSDVVVNIGDPDDEDDD